MLKALTLPQAISCAAPFPVTLTPAAHAQIALVLGGTPGADSLRIFVQGGGCSGFTYAFEVIGAVEPDDQVLNAGEFSLVVDPFSAPLLMGAVLDFEDSLDGTRFIVRNPLAVSTCGCGSSFSV